MLSILNPSVILGLILCLTGTFFYGRHTGYDLRAAEDAAVIAQKDQEMNDAKNKSDSELFKANKKLAAAQTKQHDDISSGKQQLFVRLAPEPQHAASSDGDETRAAKLDPEFAATLVGPTDRGDQIIIRYNACIKQYNEMREIVNGKR